ncbi:MAG: DNA topoisomerase 3 [Bacteroidales bacterium]|nr:DNA topoisomerase 3 [Bacteroidales bacterium]
MILCIAEKPSVGREIARVLGATTAQQGYMEGNGYWVSWTFGHLCCLQEPHDYSPDWKQWRMECLPMLPPTFKLKVIDNEGIRRQFGILSDLIGRCEGIVNCGDAGQEGEVIQRWVMQKAGCKVPVKRLWISALTEEAIKDGFAHLYPASDFDNLYAAGSARAIGDWLLGMNATRGYTLKYGRPGQVLSIGRVQTPTLAILVERQKAIDSFVPKKYWELRTLYRGGLFVCDKGRIGTEEAAEALKGQLEKYPLEIAKITRKKGKEAPPRLFDLTLLQVECNKKFGFSAERTLQLIQSLYEKKLTTYPRVDTSFLPNELHGKAPGILRNLVPYATFVQPLLQQGKLPKRAKVFNDKKITDHHAIIPTGEWAAASGLSKDEKYVLDLVVRRFIAVFYPDCEFASTVVNAKVATEGESYAFKATGKQILSDGWRVLFPAPAAKNEATQGAQAESSEAADNEAAEAAEKENVLPEYKEGESGPHTPSVVAKQTQPPRYMSEGDLLRAMETAGKQVEDEELRDLMKENGIGRPSTRAAIIETLIKRQYIRKEKKRIVPTPLGMALIDIIPNELLKSAELTGQWEKKLKQISEGGYPVRDFMAELKQMVVEVTWQVMQAERKPLGEEVPA